MAQLFNPRKSGPRGPAGPAGPPGPAGAGGGSAPASSALILPVPAFPLVPNNTEATTNPSSVSNLDGLSPYDAWVSASGGGPSIIRYFYDDAVMVTAFQLRGSGIDTGNIRLEAIVGEGMWGILHTVQASEVSGDVYTGIIGSPVGSTVYRLVLTTPLPVTLTYLKLMGDRFETT